MTLQLPSAADLPRSIPEMQTYDRLTAAFPAAASGTSSRWSRGRAVGRGRSALAELADRTASDPLFAHDRAPEVRASDDGRIFAMTIGVPFDDADERAAQSLQRLRGELVPQTLGKVSGVTYAVGGDVAGSADFVVQMRTALPWVVGFVLVLTFLVMLVTFRSVVVALTAIVLNTLSAARRSACSRRLPEHLGEPLLDFRSNGGVVAWLPLLLFVILFGCRWTITSSWSAASARPPWAG
jgi:RND superfamily putative drug exporter